MAVARKAIGPDILLMLDANNAWADVPTAMRYVERFAPYDPYWIEESFSPDQIENHAKLASAIRIPVATVEIEAGPMALQGASRQEGSIDPATGCVGMRRCDRVPAHETRHSPLHCFEDGSRKAYDKSLRRGRRRRRCRLSVDCVGLH